MPLSKPITTNLHTIDKLFCLATSIRTNNDLFGKSFISHLGRINPVDIVPYINSDLIKKINTHHSLNSAPSWSSYWKRTKKDVKSIPHLYALSAIDIAAWDLLSKDKNVPLHNLLLNRTTKVPVYGTTGWLSLNTTELLNECQKYAEMGVSAFKVRVGHKNDLIRIKTLRTEMGDNFKIMLDANQQYHLNDAFKKIQLFSEFNISWFEEPTKSLEDTILVGTNSLIPIAIGENMTKANDFHHICSSESVSFIQPDILRCGGITGFIKIAKIVKRYNLQLCNHLLPEISMNLLSTDNNGYILEYDDLLPSNIFTNTFQIEDGFLHLNDSPGTGVEVNDDAIKRYGIYSKIVC